MRLTRTAPGAPDLSPSRAGARDHHVVDRIRQVLEGPLHRRCIAGVERRGHVCVELERRLLQAFRIPARENDIGALGAGSPSGFLARCPRSRRSRRRSARPAPARGRWKHWWFRWSWFLQLLVSAPDHGVAAGSETAKAQARWSAFTAAAWISEKLGNGWIVSRSTSIGTRARIASVACCSHSPASGPSA